MIVNTFDKSEIVALFVLCIFDGNKGITVNVSSTFGFY